MVRKPERFVLPAAAVAAALAITLVIAAALSVGLLTRSLNQVAIEQHNLQERR